MKKRQTRTSRQAARGGDTKEDLCFENLLFLENELILYVDLCFSKTNEIKLFSSLKNWFENGKII